MKTMMTVLIMVLIVVVWGVGSSWAGEYVINEFAVDLSNSNIQYPVVSDGTIVWNVSQAGSYEIYGYDVSTQTTSLIHSRTTRLEDPSFGGDIIAWRDYRNDNADVYGYNLATRSEMPIATGYGTQYTPGVSEDGATVAYYSNGEMYAYNIQNEDNVLISTSGVDHPPSASGDIVVWTDSRNGNKDIYAYNLTTQEESAITTDPGDQAYARIGGNYIVWGDDNSIMGYDLTANEEFFIASAYNGDIYGQPDISGDIVVFNRDGDIYGYSLLAKEEFAICTDAALQRNPRISGSIVVWNDFRTGTQSVYGAEIVPEPLSLSLLLTGIGILFSRTKDR